jgi:choline dehydrogenase-like flavoprotein
MKAKIKTPLKSPVFDVAIIGAGASGTVAVKDLTARGYKVALIDAGDCMGPSLEDLDEGRWREKIEKDYPIQSKSEIFRRHTEHFFVKDSEFPYAFDQKNPFYWVRSHALGGRMNLWTGECYRLSDLDFKAASRDGHGIDWPISHQDLDPDYKKAEELLQVRGHYHNHAALPDGSIQEATPFNRNENFVRERLAKMGAPVILDRLATYQSGKAPNLSSALHAAEATGNLTHFPNCMAHKLNLDPTGIVESVEGIAGITRTRFFIKARAFFLCASTIASTRILLASNFKSQKRKSVLGRYLNDHLGGPKSLFVEGVFPDQDSLLPSTPTGYDSEVAGQPRILYVPRYQNMQSANRPWPFQRGFCTRVFMSRLNPYFVRFSLTAFGEALSYEENSVELNPALRDRWGAPSVKINFSWRENEQRLMFFMRKDLANIAQALTTGKNGGQITSENIKSWAPGLANHEVGTCRMGDNPEQSYLNSYCQAHDYENLFVTDGSSFSSIGTANPTLTIMALTFRATEYLSRQM